MQGAAIQPHISLGKDQCRKVAIVVGDQERARSIAASCEEHKELAWNREYRSFDCKYDGSNFMVVSHGVGASGATVCFEELIQNGVEIIIRAGTAGSLAPSKYRQGDIIACYAAASEDGTSRLLAPQGYPAVASPDVYEAIIKAGHDLKIPLGSDIAVTSDLFYSSGLMPSSLETFAKGNIGIVEMELAPLFILARLRKVKAAGLCCIDGSPFGWSAGDYDPTGTATTEGKSKMIRIALTAASRLAKQF